MTEGLRLGTALGPRLGLRLASGLGRAVGRGLRMGALGRGLGLGFPLRVRKRFKKSVFLKTSSILARLMKKRRQIKRKIANQMRQPVPPELFLRDEDARVAMGLGYGKAPASSIGLL